MFAQHWRRIAGWIERKAARAAEVKHHDFTAEGG
jgi:hypothetical protein